MTAFSPLRLRQARLALGVSQRVFAGMLGVTDRTLLHWESGTRTPNAAHFICLCEVTGLSAQWFSTGQTDRRVA